MIFAFFLRGVHKFEAAKIEPETIAREDALLPLREIGFMYDLNLLCIDSSVGTARIEFVVRAGPWCGFFLEL